MPKKLFVSFGFLQILLMITIYVMVAQSYMMSGWDHFVLLTAILTTALLFFVETKKYKL